MKLEDLKKELDNAFGDRHLNIKDGDTDSSTFNNNTNDNIPGTRITYSQVGLENMTIPGFMNTKLKIMQHQGLYKIPKHQLLRDIFEGWWIMGKAQSILWIDTNAEGLEVATLAIKNFEDLHYGEGKHLDRRTNCNDPELVAFRIAIIQGADVLHRSPMYSKYAEDKEVSRELMEDLIKHTS